MTAGNFTLSSKQPNSEQNYTDREDAPRRSGNRKFILAIIGALTLVIVIAIITIASVYFGILFHRESFKKFTTKKYSPEGDVYKQEYQVSSDELIVSYTDGVAVFDRRRGLLLYKGKNGTSKCYIAPYNVTDLPDASAIEQALTKKELDKPEVDQLIDYIIRPTGVLLTDTNTISPAARKVCTGTDIEWAYLSKESGRHLVDKRAAPPEIDIKITKDGCTITCRFKVAGVDVKISVDIPWSMLKKN